MAFGPGIEPKFERIRLSYEEMLSKVPDNKGGQAFRDFAAKLDLTKTAFFYEKSNGTHHGREGILCVHFDEQIEEKWHNTWGQTWIGLGAWMS